MSDEVLGVGVVGLGFMGRTHLEAYAAARAAGHPVRVVAVCDRHQGRLGEFSSPGLRGFQGVDELLACPGVELVSLCTHTDSHVPLALRALAAGKHVLVEKPVAIAAPEVARLARAAAASDRLCMPAMCMRFWPGWDWLREALDECPFGPLHALELRRISPRPTWAPTFYDDPARSGGMLFDLHVHDADLVRWLLGPPRAVHTTGDEEHLTTRYDYGPGSPRVSAEGRWHPSPEVPFSMGFRARFAEAEVEYALGREAPLQRVDAAAPGPIPIAPHSGYDGEIRHALDACRAPQPNTPTLEEALALTVMLEAERASLERGEAVPLDPA